MAVFVSSSRKIIRDYSDELKDTYLYLTDVKRENGKKTFTFKWVIENIFALMRGVNYNSHFIRFGETVHRLRITTQTPKPTPEMHQDNKKPMYLLVGLTPSLAESAQVSFSLLGGSELEGEIEIGSEGKCPKTGWQIPNRKCYVEFAEFGSYARLPLTVLCRIMVRESQTSEPVIEKNSSLLSDLGSLLTDSKHSDFAVEVEGRSFHVHRAILSVRSPVFKALFLQNEMKEMQEERIVVQDSDPESVQGLIQYMYTGKIVPLTPDLALGLLSLADKYNVHDLLQEVVEYLHFNIGIEKVVQMLCLADAINIGSLKRRALSFIGRHLREVMGSEDWNLMRSRGDLLEEILEGFA